MFDQTYNNPYNYNQNGAYQYNGMQQMPKISNVLNNEEIKELQQEKSQFSLSLNKKERMQSWCNHRSADGLQDTLVYDPHTGKVTCTICGYEFRPVEAEATYETIAEAADRIVDILQTIKILYTDLPAEAAKEYFQIIPLIGKIPQLFEFAAKNFAKYEYNAYSYNNNNMGGIAMLQNLSSMFGGQMYNQQPQFNGYAAAPQQPVGYPTGAPMGGMGQPNPFGYPGASQQPMGYPQAPMGGMGAPFAQPNPVAQAQAQPAAAPAGYTPQTQGYSYTPNVAAPEAPSVVPTEEVKQTVTV